MNNKVLLISEVQIKQSSVIEMNVDAKALSKVISDVQQLVLRPVLGDALFNQIIEDVQRTKTDETFSISDSTKKLLDDYVKPFLIYAVLQDWIITNNYKLTNKGVMKLNDANGAALSADELEYAKNYYDNKLSAYKLNLINYLKSQGLIEHNTDQDVTSEAIGWYLGTNATYRPSFSTPTNSGGGSTGPISWDDVTNKPNEFNPAPHTHSYDSITGKPATFAPSAHTHSYSSITDKPTEFTPSAHTHSYASITDKPTEFNPAPHTHSYSSITNKPSTFNPSAHTHAINDVTNLQTTLNAKADLVGGYVPASQLPSFVDDVIEVASYAALPVSGEVGKMYVTTNNNKVYRWSGSVYIQIVASPGSTDEVPEGSVNKYFTDSRAVSALSSALTGKANTVHTHSVGDITDLSSYTGFDSRYYTETEVSTLISTKADLGHTHSASDITSGTISPARLGSGTASSSTYLRGDGTWSTIASSSSGWSKTGDSGTSAGTNFIGTTDNVDLVFKTNSVEIGRLGANGGVAFGQYCTASSFGFAAGWVSSAGVGGVAIGREANSGSYSIAIGFGAKAESNHNIAIGTSARPTHLGATVMTSFISGSWVYSDSDYQFKSHYSSYKFMVGSTPTNAVEILSSGRLKLYSVPEFIDNTAAIAGGLSVNTIYRTPSGDLKIVI